MDSTSDMANQDESPKRYQTSPLRSSVSVCLSPSCPPPSSSSSQSSRKENVEDVWKEINLASLHDYPITTPSTAINSTNISTAIAQSRSFPQSIFLDYLGNETNASSGRTSSLFDEMGSSKGSFLSLNSESGCQYTQMTKTVQPSTSSCKRKVNENADAFDERKFKRLIKNRESAARSRARKQAYTTEMELEVARLQQENAWLRRTQELFSASAAQHPKKPTLRRTLTWPF